MKKIFTYDEVSASIEEKINIIKKDTNYFDNIDEDAAKSIYITENSDVYVLLNSGVLFKNGEKIREKIVEIWRYNGNTILCIRQNKEIEDMWKNIVLSYKKIVVGEDNLICLKHDKSIKIYTNPKEFSYIMIDSGNLINVEDIGIEKGKYEEKPYVIHENRKIYLYE